MIQQNALVLSLCIATVGSANTEAAPATEPTQLTEDQAVQQALLHSPLLAVRKAEVEQAEGRLVSARTYVHNPEIAIEAARRDSGDESFNDRGFELAQEIEFSGARGARESQATAELDAASATLQHESRLVVARVRAAFTDALRARESLAIEHANTELVQSLAEAARKGMELGASTQIETNVALSQLGRARRALHQAEADYDVARAVLAAVIGSGQPEGPIPVGTLEVPDGPVISLPELLEVTRTSRADLAALRSAIQAAQARIKVASREAIPNVGLTGFREREGTDTVNGLSLTVAVPLFNRNQGAVREAEATERRAEAELRHAEAEASRTAVESLARLLAAGRLASELRSDVVGRLQDSLRLLLRSYEVGKIGFPEVVAFRRELVEAQREYLDTLANARMARIELDLITGREEAVRPAGESR